MSRLDGFEAERGFEPRSAFTRAVVMVEIMRGRH
jgi:hypothetical protein